MSQLYFATIRDRKGNGNNYLSVRLRNMGLQYWNFTSNSWQDFADTNTVKPLTEYQDTDTLQSRYATVVSAPSGTGIIAEYVEVSTGNVVGEEGLQLTQSDVSVLLYPIQSSIDSIPTNPVLTTDIRLDNLDTKISTRSTFDGGPVQSVIDPVTVGTNTDKGGYSGVATNMVSEPDNSSISEILAAVNSIPTNPLLTIDSRLDNLDAPISQTSKSTDTAGIISGMNTIASEQSAKLDIIAEDASKARKLQSNKAVISDDGLTVTIYDDDNTTVLYIFDINKSQKIRAPRA